jgi:hypothetical protein
MSSSELSLRESFRDRSDDAPLTWLAMDVGELFLGVGRESWPRETSWAVEGRRESLLYEPKPTGVGDAVAVIVQILVLTVCLECWGGHCDMMPRRGWEANGEGQL